MPVRCDQRSEQDLLDLFQHIQSKFGKLDGCVINAGIVKPGAILNGSSEAWREMTEVCVRSKWTPKVAYHGHELFYR